MPDRSPERLASELEVSKPKGLDLGLWEDSTPEQKQVLARITRQRARLKARASAQAQTKALREVQASEHVLPDAPLPERLMSFVRLHPVATAAAGALLLVIGPRKLIRWGGVALPWIMKLQQRRNG